MTSQTNEQALESAIEKRLTGSTLEELKQKGISLNTLEERSELYRSGNGYYIGSLDNFNLRTAIDETRFRYYAKPLPYHHLQMVSHPELS